MTIGLWGERLKKFVNRIKKSRKKRTQKRKPKDKNIARGKGNKINKSSKRKTSNKCRTPKQKRKTTWIVQNSMRQIAEFNNNAKIPGEKENFDKIVGQMTTSNMTDEVIDGYWVIQWRLKRTPGRYGHYFLSYSEEYPDDIKVKNKNLYLDSEGGYKKRRKKRRKTRKKRRGKKGGGDDFLTWLFPRNKSKKNK